MGAKTLRNMVHCFVVVVDMMVDMKESHLMMVVDRMVGMVESHWMMLVEMMVVLVVFGLDFDCWEQREPHAFPWLL